MGDPPVSAMLTRRHRVALVDAVAGTVAVTGSGALPAVDGTWPTPGDLARAVGLTALDELCPPWRDDDGWVTHVMQKRTDAASAALSPMTVVPLDDALDIAPRVRERIADGIAAWESGRVGPDLPDWYRASWRAEVDAWVDAALHAAGCVRIGEGAAEKFWSLSAVLRYRVADAAADSGQARDVWFKATYGGFRAEPAITVEIAVHGPELVPTVIAADLDRAWMLLENIPGAGTPAPLAALVAAATAVAELQLRAVAFTDRLVAAGAPVRDTAAMIEMLRHVVDGGIERGLRSAAVDAAVHAAQPGWEQVLRTLASSGLPLTLVHGDLHAENVAGSAERPIVFDWTDACISHPYLDARHLAESAAQHAASEDTDGDVRTRQDAARNAVWEAFSAPWRAAFPEADHDAAWAATAVAERVFTLGSYEQIYRAQPEVSRWELGGISADHLLALLAIDGDGGGAP